jgi:hypothetical protein
VEACSDLNPERTSDEVGMLPPFRGRGSPKRESFSVFSRQFLYYNIYVKSYLHQLSASEGQ